MWTPTQRHYSLVTTLKTDPHYQSFIPFYPLCETLLIFHPDFTYFNITLTVEESLYLLCASTSWMSNPTPEALALDIYKYIYVNSCPFSADNNWVVTHLFCLLLLKFHAVNHRHLIDLLCSNKNAFLPSLLANGFFFQKIRYRLSLIREEHNNYKCFM
jgi:hypothetical protein